VAAVRSGASAADTAYAGDVGSCWTGTSQPVLGWGVCAMVGTAGHAAVG
jgi:hypothetical protein